MLFSCCWAVAASYRILSRNGSTRSCGARCPRAAWSGCSAPPVHLPLVTATCTQQLYLHVALIFFPNLKERILGSRCNLR